LVFEIPSLAFCHIFAAYALPNFLWAQDNTTFSCIANPYLGLPRNHATYHKFAVLRATYVADFAWAMGHDKGGESEEPLNEDFAPFLIVFYRYSLACVH